MKAPSLAALSFGIIWALAGCGTATPVGGLTGRVVHIKTGVAQAVYEADLGACVPEGNAAAEKMARSGGVAGPGLAGAVAGGVAAGLVDAARMDSARRDGISACLVRKGYARTELPEDPAAQFPGMGHAQLRRLNAHIAAGNSPGTFVP